MQQGKPVDYPVESAADTVAVQPESAAAEELKALVARAKQGDVSVLPRLREVLDQHEEVWKHVGDLDRIVTQAWAAQLGGRNLVGVEAIKRQADQMRRDLEGDFPTPLEKLLVGHVVATWLEWHHAQLAGTGVTHRNAGQTDHLNKRLDAAQKRYLAAIKSLSTTRVLLPAGLVEQKPLRIFNPAEKRQRA
jgi:hypothetical protein